MDKNIQKRSDTCYLDDHRIIPLYKESAFINNCRNRDLRNSFLHRQVHKEEVTLC